MIRTRADTPAGAPGADLPLRSGRVRIARILAWVLALVAAVPMFGIIDLITLIGWVDPAYEWEIPLEVSWGVLFTFLIAGSYVWIALLPDRSHPAVLQLCIVTAALLISCVGGADARPVWVALPLMVSVILLARLTASGWRIEPPAGAWRSSKKLRWPYLGLTAAGLVIWLPYVLFSFEKSRTGIVGDVTNGIEHWPIQGAAGLALVACVFGMTVWPSSAPLLRVTVSLSATLIGAAMLAFPDRAGAMDDPLWGIGMAVWGTAVALVPPRPTATGASDGDASSP